MIFFLKFLQSMFRIIFFLAPAGAALFFMRFAAWLTQSIVQRTKLKSTVAKNIKLVLPQAKAQELSDKLIRNASLSIFEVLCIPFFRKKHFQSIVHWQGLDNLNRALNHKRGAIILTMHAGNYEMLSSALACYGYKTNATLRATEDPIFEIVNRSRAAGGTKLINVLEENIYKETLKILEKNELIGFLADTGALESRHTFLKFLGKEVPVATGWLTLAQRAKCPVIPTLSRHRGNENHITLHEPFFITKDNRDEVLQKISKIFEDYVRQNPEEWLIFLNSYETERMMGLRD